MQGSDNVKKKGPNLSAKLGNHERENLDIRFWDVTSYRLYTRNVLSPSSGQKILCTLKMEASDSFETLPNPCNWTASLHRRQQWTSERFCHPYNNKSNSCANQQSYFLMFLRVLLTPQSTVVTICTTCCNYAVPHTVYWICAVVTINTVTLYSPG